MKIRFLTCSATLAVACPAAAIAQTSVAGDSEEIVVVATGFEQPADETGQAISVIDRTRLDALQSVTVSDALRTLASVSIAERGPVGTQTSVFVRGGNSSHTLVLVDGVRVNDPSSPNAAFDFGSLLAGNAERIEVLRGPNSIIWGSQAIGGVVNIETAKPDGPLKLRASAEYGAYDTASGRITVSGSTGAIGYSIDGSYYRTDGYSVFSGGDERDGGRQGAINARLTFALAENVELDLRGQYGDTRSQYDSAFSGGANSLAQADNTQWFAYAGLNVNLADDRFKSRLSFSRYDIDRVGTDPIVFSFNNYVATGIIERLEYRGAFDISEAVQIVAGAEHEQIRSSTSYEVATPDRANDKVTGAYLQVSVQPAQGLTATGGLRHDDYSDYGGHTTLGGNIAYTPNDGQTVLRATYGEGFRAPTLTEGQPPYGNTALKPETAKNLDLGVEHSLLDGKITLSATWFQRRSTNLITFSFTSFQSENIGSVRTKGVELGLTMKPTSSLRFEANYARVDATNRTDPNAGKRLPLRPMDSASVSADWATPFGLTLGATMWMVGDSFDNAANTVQIDGYQRLDLRASLPISDTVELFGRVENVTDTQYETVAGYNTAGRSAYVGARLKM